MKKLTHNLNWLWLIFMSVFIACSHANAQANNSFEQSFASYQKNNFTEKLYVHTDKNFYVTGELLWLKIYAVNGSNKPVDMSKVAYVDVLDANQNPVLQGKIALKEGSGNGSFYVPLTLPNGTYRLRAYTNWMKNYSPEFYFEKTISIANPLRSPAAPVAQAILPDYDVQFFPEGGNLVNGLPGNIAFKVTDVHGKSVDFKGAIVGQQNDTLVRFSPVKFGMGHFLFTPATGTAYKAVVKIPGHAAIYKTLPEIQAQGYTMQLTDNENNIQVNIADNAGTSQIYCITHTRQQLTDVQSVTLNGTNARSVYIDKGKLAEGINYITLFNSNRQPVAERLYFKRPAPGKMLNLSMNIKPAYGIRKPVTLDVTSATGSNQATSADLSVAVYRVDSLQKADYTGIYQYLWLSAELKGFIEQPDYYFTHTDKQTNDALDNLMLTQGWRRFNWDNMLNAKYTPAYLPEYAGHLVTGKVVDNSSGQPAKNVITYLASPEKRAELYVGLSDSVSGRVLFETKGFYGPKEIILQTNTRKDSTYRVELQSPFSEQYAAGNLPLFSLNPLAEQDLKDYSLSMQVQNVYAGPRLRQYFNPGIDSSSFYDHPTKTYKLEDFVRFTTMEEVLREYVTNISVTNKQHHFHIRTIDPTRFLDDEPLVLLDGVPVFNIDQAFAIDPLKVQKLEAVSNRYYYGPASFEGILSFTTYKGDLGGFEVDPHAVVVDYEGLQLQREFYSPVYGTEQQAASRIPDFRNVLYWEPNAGTNAQGKNNIRFYTSDLPGKYVVLIQGITPNGEAGSRQVAFEVKK